MPKRKRKSKKLDTQGHQVSKADSSGKALPFSDLNQTGPVAKQEVSEDATHTTHPEESCETNGTDSTVKARPEEGIAATTSGPPNEGRVDPDILLKNLNKMIGEKDAIPRYLDYYSYASEEFHQGNYQDAIKYCDVLLDGPTLPSLFRASVNLLLAATSDARAEKCIAEAEKVIVEVRELLCNDEANKPEYARLNLETLEEWLQLLKGSPIPGA